MEKKKFLECGKVCAAHGVRGLVKVDPWCDSPKVLAGLKRIFIAVKDGGFEEHKVLSASVMGPLVLLAIEGVDSRDAAIAMKNTVLFAAREDIPLRRGAMFIQDMIGLEVIDVDTGRVYGRIKDVNDAVSSRIYTVQTPSGDVLFPAVPEFVKETDPDRGVFIRPIPGFFDSDEI